MPAAVSNAGKFIAVWGTSAIPWIFLWNAFSSFSGWPINDDPFYAKPSSIWLRSGEWKSVKQSGKLTASSVAHQATGWLASLGGEFSYRRLFLVCIAQQAFGAAALYCTSRALGLSVGVACLIATSFGLFPLYFGHAFTFMTDGPATAWAVVACCCSALGVIRANWRWLFAASCAIGWGFWIRQTNGLLILAPLIAWLVLWWTNRLGTQGWRAALWVLIIPAGCALALLESGWLVDSSTSRFLDVAPTAGRNYLKETVIAAYGGLLLTGWLMMPWMLVSARAAVVNAKCLNVCERRYCMAFATLTLIAGAIPFALTSGNACLTNSTGTFIQNAHFGPIFLSDMDEPGRWSQLGGVAWPLVFWKILSCAAIVSSSVIAWWMAWTVCAFVDNVKSVQPVHQMPELAIAMGLLVTILLGAVALIFLIDPHMDRYWLFIFAAILVWWMMVLTLQRAPCLATHTTWRWSPAAIVWTAVCLFLSAGMSTVFTHDMLAWNNARWQYVNAQLASGLKADEIDGGRDVNAWLRLDEDANSMPREGDSSLWWSGRATRSVTVGERPGWHEIGRLPWFAWATGREHYLSILERDTNWGINR